MKFYLSLLLIAISIPIMIRYYPYSKETELPKINLNSIPEKMKDTHLLKDYKHELTSRKTNSLPIISKNGKV